MDKLYEQVANRIDDIQWWSKKFMKDLEENEDGDYWKLKMDLRIIKDDVERTLKVIKAIEGEE